MHSLRMFAYTERCHSAVSDQGPHVRLKYIKESALTAGCRIMQACGMLQCGKRIVVMQQGARRS